MKRLTLLAAVLLLPNTALSDVILRVSDEGSSLRLRWTGQLTLSGASGGSTGVNFDKFAGNSSEVVSFDTSPIADSLGTISGNDPWILNDAFNNNSTGSGLGIGFTGNTLYWDASLGNSPTLIAPNRSWTFDNLSVADAFGTNLDGGPVVLWTLDGSTQTISVGLESAAIPEPGTMAGMILLGTGLAVSRFRKWRRLQ